MTTTTETKNQKVEQKQFSEPEKKKIIEKLVTARIGLLMRHPFFGNMATRLQLVDASDWLSTLATDGRKFYYNISFVDKLTTKECEFGFAHEVLHNVFDHMGRRDTRNPKIANIAADYAVNQICKDERIGEFPKFMKVYQDDKYRGWSFEKIYDELESHSTKIDISSLGELLDEHLNTTDPKTGQPTLTPDEIKAIRDEIREAMIAAATAAGAGRIPAGIKRLIQTVTEPKMDWKQLLRMNIQSIFKNNYSFSRPNRKSQHSGVILPGLINQETIDVYAAIDMSGSISNKQAADFISEIKGIMDEFKDFKLGLWCFDTKIYNYELFSSENLDDILAYEAKGGGGTDFDVNFEFMKDNDINPKKFIMFTDGYPCGSWGDPDFCDTLFIIHGNDSIVAPFGQTAYYE